MSADVDYEIAVVGAGVAGLVAARDAARSGLRVVLVDRVGVGGRITAVEDIDNFPLPGYPTSGYELGVALMEEAEAEGAEVVLAEATGLAPAHGAASGRDTVSLTVGGDALSAIAVVLAGGSEPRPLDVVGGREFAGRGVSHCASCDGPLFRGRDVVVVGGGDSACDEAAVLARFARDVRIVHTGRRPTADPARLRRALAHDNVRLVPGSTVSRIDGDGGVSSVVLRELATGAEAATPADGVFVYIGASPNTGWLGALPALDRDGRVVVDAGLMTSVPGVFAAGDIRAGAGGLLAGAVDDGRRAALAAVAHVRRRARIPS